MYKIERRGAGFMLTFEGELDVKEAQRWYDESVKILKSINREESQEYGVIVDMRKAKPRSLEADAIIEKGQKLYREAGMLRSAVLLQNKMLQIQVEMNAMMTGVYNTERYLSGEDRTAIAKAINWVKEGIEP